MARSFRTGGHSGSRVMANIIPKPAVPYTRRQWLAIAVGGAASLAGVAWFGKNRFGNRAAAIPLTMYASAGCECCHKWVAHLEGHGFAVKTTFLADVTPKKDALGVPASLRSCHTAEVGGYVVEGHVPADVLSRFLAERPAFHGLAAPGMPGGSPGMENTPKQPFDVIAFTSDGQTSVYASA